MPRLSKRQAAGRANSAKQHGSRPVDIHELETNSGPEPDEMFDLELELEAPQLIEKLNALKKLTMSDWQSAESKFSKRDETSERSFYRHKRAKLEREHSMKGSKTLFSYWGAARSIESTLLPTAGATTDESDAMEYDFEGIECEVNHLYSCESADSKLQEIVIQKKSDITDAQRLQCLAMQMYMRLLRSGMRKTAARNQVALQLNWTNYKARRITHWSNQFLICGEIPQNKRGSHSKVVSIFSDESVQLDIKAFLRSNKKSASPKTLKAYLETVYFPEYLGFQIRKEISEKACRKWMKLLGWQNVPHRKDIYVDGHERPDVVAKRVEFLNAMEALESYLLRVDETNYKTCIQIPPITNGQSTHILVTHDETVFSANDGDRSYWAEEGQIRLLPKGKGKGIMISDFLTHVNGRLKMSNENHGRMRENSDIPKEACQILEFGRNFDGYWQGNDVALQVR